MLTQVQKHQLVKWINNMKHYLFFDTETSGLPQRYSVPFHVSLDNWPRIVSLSWILTDSEGNEISKGSSIVKPDGFLIEKGSIRIHGITQEKALKEGMPLKQVLLNFLEDYQRFFDNTILVAHNMNFDCNVLFSELMRTFPEHSWMGLKPTICTMLSLTNFCELPGRPGYKWPKLEELHWILFNKGFDNAHNSMADTEALKRCFFEALKYENAKKALLS